MPSRYADIALPLPLDRLFTYLIPPELADQAAIGKRALVPFGRKHLTGVIVALPEASSVKNLRPLRDVLDSIPTFSAELLDLTRWIAEYYLVPLGEVLRAATPQGFAHESEWLVHLRNPDSHGSEGKHDRRILESLRAGPRTIGSLRKAVNLGSLHAILRRMEQQGVITLEERVREPKARPKFAIMVRLTNGALERTRTGKKALTPKQDRLVSILKASDQPIGTADLLKRAGVSSSTLKAVAARGLVQLFRQEVKRASGDQEYEPVRPMTYNAHQEKAVSAITAALDDRRYKAFLLHGVTGSGKTEVYIEAIRHVLASGKTAMVLVPEISLTPQTVRRFRSHFRDLVTVMHSQMSIGERFDAWRSVRDGSVRIVIGPRSVVFAPLSNPGLIIVDEEHEATYKQFDASPRYHARDVAIVRGSISNAVVVLGSATPSVESMFNARSGKYGLLELPERVDRAQMPRIDIIDMTRERKAMLDEHRAKLREQGAPFPKQMPQSSLSRLLEKQIRVRLERNEGVILLQNRRGFSHVLECFHCGYVERCDQCDVTMTFHSVKKHLRCHYCGAVKKPPTVCPTCGGTELRHYAFGTQQVHEELQERFPHARILRMDLDTTTKKGAHDRLLRAFGGREADILLGTQMVAKGLDFPHVTLVGVISADTQMLLPDFRSAERTFQLLTQVAGRAGRSSLAGEVVIQTMQASHYSLEHVLTHDYTGFYQKELQYRKELDYPPYSRIILIEFKGKNESDVHVWARRFAEVLRKASSGSPFHVLGPADAAIPRIRGMFRKQVVVKDLKAGDPSGSVVRRSLQRALQDLGKTESGKGKKVSITVDIDPQSLL